ncbi:type II toxin-antitoxin system HicB family antitoxin, partial [Desulfocurvus sp.]|uniref:type II toxin-antitoxin system HicB family antitoxin n=1 Tax=Desulfocurvus sp. TaxID=2871698 RepID=UPI0025BF9248
MRYPIIVHTDPDSPGYSASIPDFPGCFTAGDTLEELAANVQEAVELYLEDGPLAPWTVCPS